MRFRPTTLASCAVAAKPPRCGIYPPDRSSQQGVVGQAAHETSCKYISAIVFDATTCTRAV